MKIGLFPMVADVLHAGHILAIKEAKAHCDYLIVTLYCKPERKPNIVQSIFERYIQLDAVKYVDEVIPYEDSVDACRVILSLQFDIYFAGADYKNNQFDGKDLLKNMGKEIYYLSRNHTMSSTNLKSAIINKTHNTSNNSSAKVIAVDFDGCICELDFPRVGKPNWEVINALKKEKDNGAKLILWTCRCGDSLDDAVSACREWGIQFDAINENLPERLLQYGYSQSRKISADEYWDDLAIIKKYNHTQEEN